MSVTSINIFEVPAADEAEFIAAWEKTRDYLKTFPAHIETACTSRCTMPYSGS
jgi:hypothetical protein